MVERVKQTERSSMDASSTEAQREKMQGVPRWNYCAAALAGVGQIPVQMVKSLQSLDSRARDR